MMRRLYSLLVLGTAMLGAAGCETTDPAGPVQPVAADDPALIRVMTGSCVGQLSSETNLTPAQVRQMCACMAPVAARHMPPELRAELRSAQPSGRRYPVDRAAMDAELRATCPDSSPYLQTQAPAGSTPPLTTPPP